MKYTITKFWLFKHLSHLKSDIITAADILCGYNNHKDKSAVALYTTANHEVCAVRVWMYKTEELGVDFRKIPGLTGKKIRCLSASLNLNALITEDGDVYEWQWLSGRLTKRGVKGVYCEACLTWALYLDENGNLYWWGQGFQNILQFQRIPLKMEFEQKVEYFRSYAHGLAITQNGSVFAWGQVVTD